MSVVCWVVACADGTLHCSSQGFHVWPTADNPDAEDTCVANAANLDDDEPPCGPHVARPLVFGSEA